MRSNSRAGPDNSSALAVLSTATTTSGKKGCEGGLVVASAAVSAWLVGESVWVWAGRLVSVTIGAGALVDATVLVAVAGLVVAAALVSDGAGETAGLVSGVDMGMT